MKIRKLLLFLLLMTAFRSQAEPVWTLTTDAGRDVALDQIEYLLSTGGSGHFSIVLTNSDVINNVEFATFSQKSGIDDVIGQGEQGVLLEQVADVLNIKGCDDKAEIGVYSVGGQLLLRAVAEGGTASLDVSSFPAGYYILKVGKTTVKFTKK